MLPPPCSSHTDIQHKVRNKDRDRLRLINRCIPKHIVQKFDIGLSIKMILEFCRHISFASKSDKLKANDGFRSVALGQFHQHDYAQLLPSQRLWPSISISPTKLYPTVPVRSTRSEAQLLRCTLFAVRQYDQCKFTGTKAAQRMLMKLTPCREEANLNRQCQKCQTGR